MTRPAAFLKYAGSKRASVEPIIAALLGSRDPRAYDGLYVEPFFGSGAVFFALRARGYQGHAYLNDVNARLMQLYLTLRDDLEELLAVHDAMPWGPGWEGEYARIRQEFNEKNERSGHVALVVDTQQAARFLWLNKSCFNGLYRENKAGEFNVPVGRYAKLTKQDPDDLRAASKALQNTTITSYDFRVLLDRADGPHRRILRGGVVVYADPPYVALTETSDFASYASGGFSTDDQRALALAAIEAARQGARVVLSNHDTPFVRDELYPTSKGFEHIASLQVKRAINSKADKRGAVAEILVAIGALP